MYHLWNVFLIIFASYEIKCVISAQPGFLGTSFYFDYSYKKYKIERSFSSFFHFRY